MAPRRVQTFAIALCLVCGACSGNQQTPSPAQGGSSNIPTTGAGGSPGSAGAGGSPGSAGASAGGGRAAAGTGGANADAGQGGGGGQPPTSAARPNIVFILVDDMGWGDLGVFYQNARVGGEKFMTPQLDRFASEGLQLRRHYTPAPVCAPARASLLLGVHQGHSNIRNNQFDQTLDNNHTLGTVLKGAGYATAAIGKWGLQGPGAAPQQPSRPGLRGFDYFFGFLSHRSGHYHYPDLLAGVDDQGQPNAFFENTTNITNQLSKCYSTDVFTARAKKWIVEQRGTAPNKPFFLYLAYTAPHSSLHVPTDSHITATSNYPAGGGLTGGVQWLGNAGGMINTARGTIDTGIHPDYAAKAWPIAAKRHATMVRRLDDAVGDILQLLKDLAIDDKTLIVFSSDNGPHNESGLAGGPTQDPTFFRSYGPFEGIKRDVHEGGVREPTLARWPGHVVAGAITQTPSQFHDWMPTFAALAGVPEPARSDGVSLVPTLTKQGVQRDSNVYIEYDLNGITPAYPDFVNHGGQARNQMQVLYLGRYKGVRTNIASANDPFRIYDTEQDPTEATDLAGKPGVPAVADYRARMSAIRRANAGAPRPYDATPIAPVSVNGLVSGLDFFAYEMATPWVPSWATVAPAAQGKTGSLDLSVRTRDADFGVRFTGYLEVPTTGAYTFSLSTDTGAFVRIHEAQLIDADFAYVANSERSSGVLTLTAGRHPISIHYRHGSAAQHALTLAWEGPRITKQPVPASAWFH